MTGCGNRIHHRIHILFNGYEALIKYVYVQLHRLGLGVKGVWTGNDEISNEEKLVGTWELRLLLSTYILLTYIWNIIMRHTSSMELQNQ
jgi:hypothetical protein